MPHERPLDQIVKSLTGPGVSVLEPAQERNLIRLAKELGFRVFSIDGERARSKHELLTAFADAFGFPDYFGYNWDALDECIRDLSWLGPGNSLLIVQNAHRLLSLAAGGFAVLVDLLDNATIFWKAKGTIFAVALLGGADLTAAVEHGLAEG